MNQFLENLRQKPEHHRHMIRLGVSAGFTALLFVAWIGYMAVSLNSSSGSLASVHQVTPVETFGENIKELGSSVASKWNDLVGEIKTNLQERNATSTKQ